MDKSMQWAELLEKANRAGFDAAVACVPRVMVVREENILINNVPVGDKVYYEPDGACGFAWVVIRPGNSPFANWLKKVGKARKHWQSGVCIWISDYNQSMAKKEAHAYAMAKVFAAAGIKAYADSRMD